MKCTFDVQTTSSQLLILKCHKLAMFNVCVRLFIFNSLYLSTLLTCCCDCEYCAKISIVCFSFRFSIEHAVIKQCSFFSLHHLLLLLLLSRLSLYLSLNVSELMQKQSINNRLKQSIAPSIIQIFSQSNHKSSSLVAQSNIL